MTGVQTETGVLAGDERMLIDGELQHTSSGATFDVIHPASEAGGRPGHRRNGRRHGARGRGGAAGVRRRRLVARSRVPLPLPDAVARRAGEATRSGCAASSITEVGCPVTVTGSQIESPIEEVKHWAEHGKSFEYLVDTGVHPTQLGPARRKIHYEPRRCRRGDHAVERAVLPQHRRDGAGADGGQHRRPQARAAHPVVGQRATAASSPRRPTSPPGCSTSWSPTPTRWARRCRPTRGWT